MTSTTAQSPKFKPGRSISALRPPTFTTDERGKPVVLVPLANGAGTATLDRADWDALAARGVTPNWYLTEVTSGTYRASVVRAYHAGKVVQVGRLILGATPNQKLVYAAADRTDLRRSNITLKKVNARGEGDARTGTVRTRAAWTIISKDKPKTKAQLQAELRAADGAAHAAFLAAQAERVDRWKAWIETQVAAGRDRDQVTAEGMAQARAERAAYCARHGLDPRTGRLPREPKKGTAQTQQQQP
ncbi:hypothetical protein [Inquilinus sp. Marseille-Q2685]|uniref:hypothetical protein n=1 Tax=Inquilinus sp. Marseille-Q2685 TaxID=2866581 RepID=UPI001CE40519|nr:hypothetical protein [Inquilinus sp. Marseille-Q2685]